MMSETLLKLSLFKPRILEEEEYQTLKNEANIDALKAKAVHYIGFQPRLASEVRSFLEKKEASPKQVNRIIKDLQETNLLNDENYLVAYLNQAIEYDYDGPFKVRDKLLKKGADASMVASALDKYTKKVEYQKLCTMVEKECRYKSKKPLNKVLMSLKQRYLTKGFHMDLIDQVLEEFKEDLRAQIDEEYLLKQELAKMPRKMFEKENKEKLMAKLLRKGYRYPLIKEIIKGGDFDEDIN